MNISKSYTATRKCHTSTPSELCQPHSQQDICRCHFLLKLLHPHIRHPPGCRSADWSGAGFQHLPCPPLSLCFGVCLLIWLARPSPLAPPFLFPCPTPTHPLTVVVLLVRRLDWLLPPTLQPQPLPFHHWQDLQDIIVPSISDRRLVRGISGKPRTSLRFCVSIYPEPHGR